MENFSLGIAAALGSLGDFVRAILAFQLLWGFALGFIVAVLMYGFIASASPKQRRVGNSLRQMFPRPTSQPTRLAVLAQLGKTFLWLSVLVFLLLALLSTFYT